MFCLTFIDNKVVVVSVGLFIIAHGVVSSVISAVVRVAGLVVVLLRHSVMLLRCGVCVNGPFVGCVCGGSCWLLSKL